MSHSVAHRAANPLLRSCFRFRHCFVASRGLFPDEPPRPLPCTTVRVSPLPSYGQPAPMANPSIASEVHQALDIHQNVPPQVSLDHAPSHLTPQGVKLGVRQAANGHVRPNAGPFANIQRTGPADTINVRQRHPDMLPVRDVHAGNSRHCNPLSSSNRNGLADSSLSTLPLLVPRILAYHTHGPLAADHLAVPAQSLDRRSHFHVQSPSRVSGELQRVHIPSDSLSSKDPHIDATSGAIAPVP